MKKLSIIIALIMATGLNFACKKTESTSNDSNAPKQAVTELEFTVLDEAGQPVANMPVKLYNIVYDYLNEVNQVAPTLKTNIYGKVVFANLSDTIFYHYRIENGCQNNFNGNYFSDVYLKAGKRNTITLVVKKVGTMYFKNNSNNPYRIFINGEQKWDMPGNTDYTLKNVPVGAKTIRVLQLSGYVLFPTDKTYSGELTCGSTLETLFP